MSRDNVLNVSPIEQDRMYNDAGSLSTDIRPSSSMHDHTYCTSLSEDVVPSYRVLRRYSNDMYYGPDAPFIPHNSDIPTMTGVNRLEQKRCIDNSRLNIEIYCPDAHCINHRDTRTLNNDPRQLDTLQYQDTKCTSLRGQVSSSVMIDNSDNSAVASNHDDDVAVKQVCVKAMPPLVQKRMLVLVDTSKPLRRKPIQNTKSFKCKAKQRNGRVERIDMLTYCVMCQMTFNTDSELACHNCLHHDTVTMHQCFECNAKFMTVKALGEHSCIVLTTARGTGRHGNKRRCLSDGDQLARRDDASMDGEYKAIVTARRTSTAYFICPCCDFVFCDIVQLAEHQETIITAEIDSRYFHRFRPQRKPSIDLYLRVHCDFERVRDHPYCLPNVSSVCQVCRNSLDIRQRRICRDCLILFCAGSCYEAHRSSSRFRTCAVCNKQAGTMCRLNFHKYKCYTELSQRISHSGDISKSHICTEHSGNGLSVIGDTGGTDNELSVVGGDRERTHNGRSVIEETEYTNCRLSDIGNTQHTNNGLSGIVETEDTTYRLSGISNIKHTNNRLSGIGHEEQLPTAYAGKSSIPHEDRPYVYIENVAQNDDDETVSQSSAGREVSVAPMTSLKFQKPTELYMCHRCGDIFTVVCDLRKHVTLGVCDSRIIPKMETVESCVVESSMSDNHASDTKHVNMETQSIDDYGSDHVIIKQELATTDGN